jgi:myo-inositol-1(or 4)-monophosphatase
MDSDLHILKSSLRLLEDKVRRDFFELENLQSSKQNKLFADATLKYLNTKLYDFFLEKRSNYTLQLKDYRQKQSNKCDYSIYASVLEGFENLLHGIPYFATYILLSKNTKALVGLVSNYITNETFIATTGQGAFVNSRRIRVSNRDNFSQILTSIGKSIKPPMTIPGQFIVTGCDILDCCQTASGKHDIALINNTSPEEIKLIQLFLTEAGGICHLSPEKNLMVCGNSHLVDNFKKYYE